MKRKMLVIIGLVAAFMLPGASAYATAETNTPAVETVIDPNGFFTGGEKNRITQSFEEVANKYGVLPVLEVVATTNGDDAERFAVRRANELGVGDSEADNGIFILIVEDSRALQVQPGIGLRPLISAEDVQQVIDYHMIPNFKKGDFTTGVVNGVESLGKLTTVEAQEEKRLAAEASALSLAKQQQEAAERARQFADIAGKVGLGAVGVVGAGVIGFGAIALVSRRNRIAEEARISNNEEILDKIVTDVFHDKVLLERFKNAPNAKARVNVFASDLEFADFKESETDWLQTQISRRIAFKDPEVQSAYKVDEDFYKVRFKDTESVNEFIARIHADTPAAKERLHAHKEKLRLEAEAKARHEALVKKLKAVWRASAREDRTAFALASKKERAKIGSLYFDEYDENPEIFNAFGNTEKSALETNARDEFRNLPTSVKQKIANARGSRRESLMQEYVPGYNSSFSPLLFALYMSEANRYATSYHNTQAAAASSSSSFSSSYSTSSFGSYDSSSSFGGGGFDGGGGGGNW